MNNLSEKEFDILNEIANNNALSQREVSSNTGLSLGMTNFLIKKMIKTGLIKIHQLNKKKIRYLLTKQGFVEKTNKSYKFILKTLNRYKSIEENISNLILSEYNKGKRIFYIVGKNDISNILENSIKKLQLKGVSFQTINKQNIEKEKNNPNILNTTNQVQIVFMFIKYAAMKLQTVFNFNMYATHNV